MSTGRYTKVAEVGELEHRKGMGVEVDGIEIALFYVDGEYYALNNRCPHQRAPLCKVGEKKINGEKCWDEDRGGFTDKPAIACPWHLWEINLENGEHETSGKRVAVFDVKIEDDDVLVDV